MNGISIYISELINIIYKTKNDAQPAGAPSFIVFHTCPPGKGWHRFIIGLGNISLWTSTRAKIKPPAPIPHGKRIVKCRGECYFSAYFWWH
ncbi:hypothetical protein [Kosakonia sp. MUSA4]|uniref:hypothetical protein n=1 Tax=Kosakonia sp. MUSA4 TaxID=2067958 RepID=UPI001ABF6CF5|nr:hypothetical protein [Kosakonia sp. MUSA4]